MRHQELKQQVMRNAAIMAAVVVVSLIITYVTYGFYSDTDDRLVKLNNGIRQANSSIQAMDKQQADARGALPLYQEILAKNQQGQSGLDRKRLADIIAELKKRYELVDVKLAMTPISTPTDEHFKSTKVEIEHSMVTLEISALNDELALSFIDHLLRVAPGFIRVESLSMLRTATMDDQFFEKMTMGTPASVVTSHLNFHWMGIKKIKDPANAATTEGKP